MLFGILVFFIVLFVRIKGMEKKMDDTDDKPQTSGVGMDNYPIDSRDVTENGGVKGISMNPIHKMEIDATPMRHDSENMNVPLANADGSPMRSQYQMDPYGARDKSVEV